MLENISYDNSELCGTQVKIQFGAELAVGFLVDVNYRDHFISSGSWLGNLRYNRARRTRISCSAFFLLFLIVIVYPARSLAESLPINDSLKVVATKGTYGLFLFHVLRISLIHERVNRSKVPFYINVYFSLDIGYTFV
jgi:hypothetical protein